MRPPDEPCQCGKHMLQSWWASITDAGNEGTDYKRHSRESCLTRTERMPKPEPVATYPERDEDIWLRRMSNLLDTVENPGSLPEGSLGSLHRRAWEIGTRLRAAKNREKCAPKIKEECGSCRGYGYFNVKTGEPSIDRRGRKCLDCGGEGRVVVAG